MKKVIIPQNSIETVDLKNINENFVYVCINEGKQLIGISYKKNNQFYWLDVNKTNVDKLNNFKIFFKNPTFMCKIV